MVSHNITQKNYHLLLTGVLSWVAGYIDTAGFFGLNGLFTAHVTGNLVVAGAQLAGISGNMVWVRLAVIPVFIGAIALITVITYTRSAHLSIFLWFEAVLLGIFGWVGITLGSHLTDPSNDMIVFIIGSTGVFAMGIQNGFMRAALGTLLPTTVMTGNLTQLTIDLVNLYLIPIDPHLAHDPTKKQELRQRALKFGITLLSFICGAALGAFLMRIINFWSIFLPAIAIAILAINTQGQENQI